MHRGDKSGWALHPLWSHQVMQLMIIMVNGDKNEKCNKMISFGKYIYVTTGRMEPSLVPFQRGNLMKKFIKNFNFYTGSHCMKSLQVPTLWPIQLASWWQDWGAWHWPGYTWCLFKVIIIITDITINIQMFINIRDVPWREEDGDGAPQNGLEQE